MKHLRLCVLMLATMAVAACSTAPPVDVLGTTSISVQATQDKVVLEGTRALVIAHNAYQAAAGAVTPFVAAKSLPPATVDRIEQLNNRAVYLLEKGDTGLSLARRAAEVLAIADELNRLIGK